MPPWPARRTGAGGTCPCTSVWGRTGLTETGAQRSGAPRRPVGVQGKLRRVRKGLLTRTPHPAPRVRVPGTAVRLNVATGANSPGTDCSFSRLRRRRWGRVPRSAVFGGPPARPAPSPEALKGLAFPLGCPGEGAAVRRVGGAPDRGEWPAEGARPPAWDAARWELRGLRAPGGWARRRPAQPSPAPAPPGPAAPPAPEPRCAPRAAAAEPLLAPQPRADHRAHSAAVHFAL